MKGQMYVGHVVILRWGLMWFPLFLLFLSGCGSPEERKGYYVEQAQEYLADGNYPKARVALKNAVRIDPKDTHAIFLLAHVAEKEESWQQAFRLYLRIVELEPTHRRASTRVARFYLAGKVTEQVAEMADELLSRDPQDAFGESLQAAVLSLNGEKNAALAKAEAVLDRTPTEADTLIVLAAVLASNDEHQKAHSLLQRGLLVQPDNVDLLNYLATTYVGQGAFQDAGRVFLQLLNLEPTSFKHRNNLAMIYQQLKKTNQAVVLLREGVELDPTNETRWNSLIQHTESDQRGLLIEEALETLPHSMMLRFSLAKHYEKHQESDRARALYEAIVSEEEQRGQGLKAEVQLAKLDFVEQKQDLAQMRVEKVLQENPRQFDALLLKGKMALAQKQGKEAVRAFRVVQKDMPNHSGIQSFLGQGHLLSGEFELAQENFQKAVGLNSRQFDAYKALARLSTRKGNLQEAQGYLESILEAVPTHVETLWSLFEIHLAQQQWSRASETISRMQKAGGLPYQVDLAKGLMAAARKQWDLAVQAFHRAHQAQPDDLAPLAALVKVEFGRHQPEQAKRYLKKVLEEHSDHPFASGLLGAVFVQLKDMPSALLALQRQTQINPAWVEPWKDWASLKWAQGKKAEALDVLTRALTHNSNSPALLNSLASYSQADQKIDSAIGAYETILGDNPTDVLAANNLAYLLADKRGDQQSLEKALTLTRDFESKTENPFLLDTLAWVYYKMGHHKEAASVLRKALVKAPDHPLMNYHFGLLILEAGDQPTAQKHLEKSLQGGQKFEGFEEARRLVAEFQHSF